MSFPDGWRSNSFYSDFRDFVKTRVFFAKEFFQDLLTEKWMPRQVREKTILLVEPNPYHGEILPGIFRYLDETGWNVDLFIRHKVRRDDPFCLCGKKPRIFPASGCLMKKYLSDPEIGKYDYVFLTTTLLFERNAAVGEYWDLLGFMPAGKYGTILLLHHSNEEYLQKIRTLLKRDIHAFTLCGHPEFPMLCPVFFGELPPKPKREKTRRILITGWKPPQVWMDFYQAAREILAEDPGACRFYLAGRLLPPEIPEDLRKDVTFLRDLPFGEFIRLAREMDFLFAMLDPSSEEQQHYLHGVTSGVRQLSIGLNVPLIIEETFAEAYGFSRGNAVVYGENIREGLLAAIRMDDREYDRMTGALAALADEISAQSLNDLKDAFAPTEHTLRPRKTE